MKFKKIVSAASALTIAASAFVSMGVVANADETSTTVYQNDFEASSDWTVGGSGGHAYNPGTSAANTRNSQIIGVGCGGGDKSIKLTKISSKEGYDNASLLDVEFDCKMDAVTSGKGSNISLVGAATEKNWLESDQQILTISASASGNGYWGSIAVNGTDIKSKVNETGTYEINSLNRDTTGWMHVKARINFTTQIATVTLTKDTTTVLDATPLAFINEVKQLDEISAYAGKSYGGTYLDNVSIKSVTSTEVTKTATYTVKYTDENDNEIKTSEERTGVVGSNPTLKSSDTDSITGTGVKYVYASDDASSVTIAEDGSSVVTVKFNTIAAATSFDLVYKSGNTTIGSKSIDVSNNYVGDSFTYYWPVIVKSGDDYYMTPKASNTYYGATTTLTAENNVEVTTYEKMTGDIVYYSEFTEGTAGDYPNRYSNGDAYQGSSITTDKLPAGAYKVYVGMRATRETVTATIKNGETELGTVSTSSTAVVNTDITLTSEAALTISGNSKNAEMDYVYIERTGDATKSQTFIFEGAANDFTNAKTFDISATQDNAAKATSVDGTSIFGSISGEGTYKFAVIFTGIASDMTLDSVTIK